MARLSETLGRFRRITALTRQHRQAGWINRPEYQPLRRISDEGLAISRQIAQEILRIETDSTNGEPDPLVDEMLTANEARLQTIDEQLALIDVLLRMADSLQPLVGGLLHSDGLPSTRLGSMLDDLASATANRAVRQLVPCSQNLLERVFAGHGRPHPWFYLATIQNGLWAAWLCPVLSDLDPGIRRHLTAATLLADLGCLAGARRSARQHGPAPRGSIEYQQHPSISAALIAGLRGASAEWARLAAQHHERLDGSGFPRRLAGRELQPAARCLTAIVRWSEQIRELGELETTVDPLLGPAEALWRETRRGEFDAEVVSRMLSVIRPGMLEGVPGNRRPGAIAYLDPAHRLPAPAFAAASLPRKAPLASLSRGPHTRR